MDTSAETESMVDALKGIDKQCIILPEFQRDFVWEVGKTFDLFDSLVKGIFIGSIIYGVPSFEITVREIDIRPRTGQGSRRKLKITSYKKAEINQKVKTTGFRLLLDGQQRLTSIYRALRGVDAIWFIAKHSSEIVDSGNWTASSLEDILYEFSGQEAVDRLSIKLSDVYEIMQNDYFENEKRQKFFDTLKFQLQFEESEKIEIFRNFLTITNKLQDLFKSQKLLSYYLLDTTLEKFALFFERSNSRGIQLNFIDILAAKLYDGFNLREKISVFEDRFNDFSLNKEIIVRTISFIVSGGKDIERSYILGNLTTAHFAEYWEPVCDLYVKTLEFLYKNNFILAQSWMPYENMLIPLMIFLRAIRGNFSQMTEKQSKFLRFWYWSSVFAQRYTGSTNEVTIQDALILSRIAQGERITDRNYFYKLRSQVNSAEELHSYTKKSSAVYRGILNLLNYQAGGLIDWNNTTKLHFNQSKLEDHHIFPRNYLLAKFHNNDDVLSLTDSVVNKTLIPKLTNIRIGQKAPSIYMRELEKSNPRLKESLNNHSIPSDLLQGDYDAEYLFFLEERAAMIFRILRLNVADILDEIRSEFYQEPKISEEKEKIPVFAIYFERRIEAEYYPNKKLILWEGSLYSPSKAAAKAKTNISGKDNSTNGWDFWKYVDEQGQEKCLLELRVL